MLTVEKEILPHVGEKKTVLVKAQVGDETGKADLLLRTENPDLVKEGKVIAIRNGRRQIVKGHISLQLDIFGRITEEKDEVKATGELNISEKEIPRRENRDRAERGERREGGERRERREGGERRDNRDNRDRVDRDRDYDRRPRRNDDRDRDYDRRPRRDEREGGDRRGERRDNRDNRDTIDNRDNRPTNTKVTKVKDIGPGDEDLNLKVKVVELKQRVEQNNGRERTFLDCLLADESGAVNASFFGSDDVKQGDVISLRNVIAKVVRDHIQIQRGKFGKLSEAEGDIKAPNTTNNISKKAYELVE